MTTTSPQGALPRTTAQRHQQTRQSQAMSQVVGFLVLALIAGPVAAGVSLALYALVRRSPVRYAILGGGLLLCVLVLWLGRDSVLAELAELRALVITNRRLLDTLVAHPSWERLAVLRPLGDALLPRITRLWLQTILLAPALAIYLESTRVKTLAEIRVLTRRERTQVEAAARRAAGERARRAPEAANGAIVLGAVLDGTLGACREGPWAVYPASLLNRHMVLIGGSGVGKTEFVLRVAYLVAKVYGWKVFYIDAKGDYGVARRFAESMQRAGVGEAAMLPALAYDGWRGGPTAILNRLMAIEDYSEPYYRAMAKTVLSLVCHAPAGPPASSTELLGRLSLDMLAQTYQGATGVRAETLAVLTAEDVRGVYKRYFGFFDAIDNKLDGAASGWSFDSCRAGYILLDGLALKEEARSLGRYLMEDFADYVSRRKPSSERVLLIVDEYSAISSGGADAANLFERVRSYGAGLIVTSQSYERLGEHADAIIGAAAATVAFQCADPEPLAARAGTMHEVQASIAIEYAPPATNALSRDRAHATGTASEREQEVPRLHGNVLRDLDIGECCVITNGAYLRLRAALVPSGPAPVTEQASPRSGSAASQAPRPAGPRPLVVEVARRPHVPAPAEASYTPELDRLAPDAPAPGGEADCELDL